MAATVQPLPATEPAPPDLGPARNLFHKLAEITAEIGHIEARGFHSFYKTKYVEESDLVDAVREKLAAKNVVMLPSVSGAEGRAGKTAKGKDTYITTVHVAFTFCDGDTGQTYTCPWIGAGEDLGSDGANKAITSALRTFLKKGFLVTSGEGDATEPAAPKAPRSDGQNHITDEQYQGILNAWQEAGSDERGLHELLDAQDVHRDIEGETLSLSQRVRLLGAHDAIKVQQALIDARPE